MLQTYIEEHAESRNVPQSSVVTPNRRETAWLNARLERGKKERFSEVVKVTPGLAAAMLKHNASNRPITRSQVAVHIDRLMRGDFILTHQGICFAKTSVLNDGQHRLTAIADSGVAGDMMVTFGAERNEFAVIDMGRSRTAGDHLGIHGMTYSTRRAAVAKTLLIVRDRLVRLPDPQVVADYAVSLNSKDMDDALNFSERMKKITSPSVAAVAYYWIITRTKHPDRLADFCDGLASGEGLTNPRLKLREWLREKSPSVEGGAQRNFKRVAVIINCWNAFIDGRKSTRAFSTDWPHAVKLPEPR